MEIKNKNMGIFGPKKDKEDAIAENRKPTFGFFFKLFFRKFPQLLRLNILMLFQILPLIVIAVVFLAGDKTPSATSTTFAPLYGINQSLPSPGISRALDVASIQMGLPFFDPVTVVVIVVLTVILAITWGWQNVGATYVIRGLVRGDAVFVFSDFFYGIKRNLKQGFFFGLIDFAFCGILVYDFVDFYKANSSFGSDFMYFTIFALAIIYFMMRFYIYHLLITFDMKNFKIIKNSFIFSILGIKRNILALLGIILFAALHFALILLLMTTPFGFVVILPLVYLVASTAFMAGYASYPIIDRYLIEPYAEKASDNFEYLTPTHSDDEEE